MVSERTDKVILYKRKINIILTQSFGYYYRYFCPSLYLVRILSHGGCAARYEQNIRATRAGRILPVFD